MARQPRFTRENVKYHVTAKANRGEMSFEDAAIKELMIDIIKRAKQKYTFALDNFCLMDNHIHIMIYPGKGESLSKIMQWILGVFAAAYNRHKKQKGHVFGERFKSKIIETLQQYIRTYDYIANNPVKAKMVNHPTDYKYNGITFLKNNRVVLFGLK